MTLSAAQLPVMRTASPADFDGPGDRWSPETLLVGAVADCFILTFRAVAAASKLPWNALTCSAEGVLDRVEKTTRFTSIVMHARLCVPEGTSVDQARRALEKAEHNCLITNSLNADIRFEPEVEVSAACTLH